MQYGVDNGLSALPGCPKKLTLVSAGKEYDVTPKDLARGDFCQLNVPVTVTLTLPEEEAKTMMEVELYAHTVDLRGIYETKVSLPTSKVTVKFDRSKIYNELKAELGVKVWIAEGDAKAVLAKVIEHQLMDIVVQGELSDYVAHLLDKVAAELFEPWVQDPALLSTPPCGSSRACVRLGAATLTQADFMEFTWTEETNLLSGQNYITTTKLKATPSTVQIGNSQSCSNLNFGACDRLSNDGVPRETGLTVVSGNHVSIDPELILKETRNDLNPIAQRVNHNVCISKKEECPVPLLGKLLCVDVCKYENQWADITTYGIGQTIPEVLTIPVGQLNELFDGLRFQFRWTDQFTGAQNIMECPLSAFPREGNGRTLSVRLENTPACSPFTGYAGETPMLYLVNHISFRESYLFGQKTVLWNGVQTSSPITRFFSPKVDFSGSLSIQGYSFESERSGGEVGGE